VNSGVDESDVGFHLLSNAARVSWSRILARSIERSVLPTLSPFEYGLQVGVKWFIFASSCGATSGVPDYVPVDDRNPTAAIGAVA